MKKNRNLLQQLRPLENRTYRFKKPAIEFFCPLCRSQRAIVNHHKLTVLNYLQIIAVSALLSISLWPLMEARSLFSFFFVWIGFEGARRILWRKEIPCPHCGFDASWYKTDVKVAKQKVKTFWDDKERKKESPGQNQNDVAFRPEEKNVTEDHGYF